MNCNTTHYRANSSSVPGDPTIETIELEKLDEDFKFLLVASDRNMARENVLNSLKTIKAALSGIRVKVLIPGPAKKLNLAAPDFSLMVSDRQMQEILLRRWKETDTCVAAGAYLAATVMMGGLLEGLLLARVNSHPNLGDVFKTQSAPTDRKTKKKPL